MTGSAGAQLSTSKPMIFEIDTSQRFSEQTQANTPTSSPSHEPETLNRAKQRPDDSSRRGRPSRVHPGSLHRQVSANKKILVADDSQTIRALLTTALENAGYSVDVAEDGPTTYELGKTGDYDLVVLDQLMPGLLGLEVISRWKDDGVDLPVLMLTGVDDDRTALDSFDQGAVDYVRKPFRIAELVARIEMRL